MIGRTAGRLIRKHVHGTGRPLCEDTNLNTSGLNEENHEFPEDPVPCWIRSRRLGRIVTLQTRTVLLLVNDQSHC